MCALRGSIDPADSESSKPIRVSVDHVKFWQQLFYLAHRTHACRLTKPESPDCKSTTLKRDPELPELQFERKRTLEDSAEGSLTAFDSRKRRRICSSSGPHNGLELRLFDLHGGTRKGSSHSGRPFIVFSQKAGRNLALSFARLLPENEQKSSASLTDLVRVVLRTCEAVSHQIANARDIKPMRCDIESRIGSFGEIFNSTRRLCSLMLSTVENCNRADGIAFPRDSPLVTTMPSIMRSLVGHLRHSCLEEVEHRKRSVHDAEEGAGLDSETVPRGKCNGIKIFEDVNKAIVSTLTCIMSTLAILHSKDYHTFDCTTRSFLQHVGKTMALHMSNDPLCCYEVEELSCHQSEENQAGNKVTQNDVFAARVEGPYLIKILRSFSQTMELKAGRLTGSDVCRSLQASLLEGIFGKMRLLPGPYPRTAAGDANKTDFTTSAKENAEESWFLSQVWEILGWDVLFD